MLVREMKPGEEQLWDRYVSTNVFSTPLQLAAWKKVFENVFNSKTHFLMVEDGGEITGILPLLHIQSLVTGNYVTSMPGGLLANEEESATLLLDHVKQFVETHTAKYLILRDGRRKWQDPELVTDEEHVNFLINTQNGLENIKENMRKTTRKLLKRSLSNGLTADVGWGFQREFYQVYSSSLHEIGNPTFGQNFFEDMASFLHHHITIVTLHHQGKILGGGYIAPLNQTVHCLWSGLLRDYYDLYISHFLYWEVIKYALQQGCETVNLGRCRKESGLFFFKEGFGGRVQPLYQQFYLHAAHQKPPVGAEMEDDFQYRVFTKAWRLFPQKVTEIIGPKIRKIMPFG